MAPQGQDIHHLLDVSEDVPRGVDSDDIMPRVGQFSGEVSANFAAGRPTVTTRAGIASALHAAAGHPDLDAGAGLVEMFLVSADGDVKIAVDLARGEGGQG